MNILAAVAKNHVIGNRGSIPWKIPSDMARFKEITLGKTVIMGRGTWESLPAQFRPLPGRTNIVVSRRGIGEAPRGVAIVSSLAEGVRHASTEIFVIGGAQLYKEALLTAEKLLVTHVLALVEGDVYFPEWNRLEWQVEKEEALKKAPRDEFATQFVVYKRL